MNLQEFYDKWCFFLHEVGKEGMKVWITQGSKFFNECNNNGLEDIMVDVEITTVLGDKIKYISQKGLTVNGKFVRD